MTRINDSNVDLQGRCDIANMEDHDWFISILCNSFGDPRVSGIEIFYYPGSTKGIELALVIQKAAIAFSKGKDRGIKESDFFVLKHMVMAAVLIECAFISNNAEENMINNKEWQDGFTKSLAASIASYCSTN